MKNDLELTKIERELVIKNLQEETVPLTVTLADKEKSYPLVIAPSLYSVSSAGLVVVSASFSDIQFFLGKSIYVRFYYKGLGLSLVSVVKKDGQNFAMQLPLSIGRIPISECEDKDELSAVLSFTSSNEATVTILCKPSKSFDLFAAPDFARIPKDFQNEAKNLIRAFVAEAKKGRGASIGSARHLIPVSFFLTASAKKEEVAFENIEGRQKPLQIIYADSKRFVLAHNVPAIKLQLEEEYKLLLDFKIKKSPLLHRKVQCSCTVENIYSKDERSCFICRLLNLKKEDQRFLESKFSS